MRSLRFFKTYLGYALGRLCQQRWLLAGLVLLCLLLPLGAGRAAEVLLSRGVAFQGVVLAVTAPEGDPVPQQLEQYMGDMEDIAQYCRFLAMEEDEALEALERGEVTAVLALPEGFIRGVMWGENPDLRLIVAGDRPLESLLLLWVGQSACDILSAFQGGVYAVLDLYDQAPPPGLGRDQVVIDINLRYISLALSRTDLFQTQEVPVTQVLPIPLHYALALLAYFALSAAPLFVPLYTGDWLRAQRRLRAAGRSCVTGCLSGVAAGALVLLVLIFPALILAGGPPGPALAAALTVALFASLFCALCCLAAGGAAACGAMAFLISLLSLALAGGILPNALLPAGIRRLSWLSPVGWLQRVAAWPMGYPVGPSVWACLGLSGAGMMVLVLALYRYRVDRQEVDL